MRKIRGTVAKDKSVYAKIMSSFVLLCLTNLIVEGNLFSWKITNSVRSNALHRQTPYNVQPYTHLNERLKIRKRIDFLGGNIVVN